MAAPFYAVVNGNTIFAADLNQYHDFFSKSLAGTIQMYNTGVNAHVWEVYAADATTLKAFCDNAGLATFGGLTVSNSGGITLPNGDISLGNTSNGGSGIGVWNTAGSSVGTIINRVDDDTILSAVSNKIYFGSGSAYIDQANGRWGQGAGVNSIAAANGTPYHQEHGNFTAAGTTATVTFTRSFKVVTIPPVFIYYPTTGSGTAVLGTNNFTSSSGNYVSVALAGLTNGQAYEWFAYGINP